MIVLKVVIRFIECLFGTVAKDPELYGTFIANKAPPENLEEELKTLPNAKEIEESGWTCFHEDDNGLFIYEYMVKGFLKNAGNVLKEKENLDIRALKSKINNLVFIKPRRIYLGKKEPDGFEERPIIFMTAQGPRTALKRSDYIDRGTEIAFEIKLYPHKEVTVDVIKKLLEYGKDQGLGQWRNGGWGAFEVVSCEEVDAPEQKNSICDSV